MEIDNSSFYERGHAVLIHLSVSYSTPRGRYLRVTQPFATAHAEREQLKALCLRLKENSLSFQLLAFSRSCSARAVPLACLRHAASVRPGPGSNPQIVPMLRRGKSQIPSTLNQNKVRYRVAPHRVSLWCWGTNS